MHRNTGDKLPKAEMNEGKLKPKFWNEESFCIFDKNLLEILENFHHCDTYFRTEGHAKPNFRVQGWIHVKDLPENIPQQMIKAECNPRIRNNSPVIEVWNMILNSELPF